MKRITIFHTIFNQFSLVFLKSYFLINSKSDYFPPQHGRPVHGLADGNLAHRRRRDVCLRSGVDPRGLVPRQVPRLLHDSASSDSYLSTNQIVFKGKAALSSPANVAHIKCHLMGSLWPVYS